MARNLTLSQLRVRKRLLVAQSDIYRETLRLEVHNLRLYGAGVKRKLSVLRALKPLLLVATGMLGAPLGRTLVRGRRRNWLRLVLSSLLSWRVYRQMAPFLRTILAQAQPAAPPAPASPTRDPTPAPAL